jgi:hypothetical protein
MTRSALANRLRSAGHPGDSTICASACLAALGVTCDRYRYAQRCEDIVAILRRQGFTVRDCRKELPMVSADRLVIPITKLPFKSARYLLRVAGHVLLVASDGTTLADTCPSLRNRLVTHVYRITS